MSFTQEEFSKLTRLQREFQRRLKAEEDNRLVVEIPQVEHIVNGQMVREYICSVKYQGDARYLRVFAIYKDDNGFINAVNYL